MGKDLKGKELGVGISQRNDKFYIGRYTNKYGKRVQKVFPKLQECRQWLADSQYNDEHSDINSPREMTVNAWFEYWIDTKKRTTRYNTAKSYTDRYHQNIEPVIGKTLLANVNTMQCQMVVNNMRDKGYKAGTIKQARVTLHNMLEYAYQNDIICKNPCSKMVKIDKGKPSDERQPLTIEQQAVFCKAIIGSLYEYQYRFLLQTGLRIGEMIGLKWSDIDFKKRVLTVQRSMEYRLSTGEWHIGEPKSKTGYRTIPLTDEAISVLRLQKQKNNSVDVMQMEWSEFVFLHKGTPVKNSVYNAALLRICNEINIPKFSVHVLRHTFATRCIEAGMKPKTLQMILGHSNIGVTMDLYVHTTEEEKHKEMNKIADALKII